MHRLSLIAAMGAVFSVSSFSSASGVHALPTKHRNVLLVILDDVGAQEIRSFASDLAAAPRTVSSSSGIIDSNANAIPDGLEDTNRDGYPDGAISTPSIDSLATAGVRFTQVWSNPICSPTRAGIYTGLYATHNGIGYIVGGDAMLQSIPSDVPTLAEQLTSAGSTTKKGFFGKWHLGEGTGMLPTDRGWNYFSGSTAGEVSDYNRWPKVVVDEAGTRTDTVSTDYVTQSTAADALTWIASQPQGWWATVAFNAPHTPYTTNMPAECQSGTLTGTTDVELYHRTLECADWYVGHILTGMNSTTLANTTIIFVGDNGTEGDVSQVYASDRSKASVYQGGVHVPLIVADGSIIAGRSSTATISTVGAVTNHGGSISNVTNTLDIFATVAEILGITPASSDAYSLVGWLGFTSPATHRTYSYTEEFQYPSASTRALYATLADPADLTTAEAATLTRTNMSGAIRNTDYKLIYDGTSYKFFQLSNDPFEQQDLGCGGTSSARSNRTSLLTQLRSIDSSYPSAPCITVTRH